MIQVLRETKPKARKRHQCHWCGEWIGLLMDGADWIRLGNPARCCVYQ
jgi:hypothetical protein